MRAFGLCAVFLAGCFPVIDASGLAPIDDYQDWYQVETRGAIPAHSDTIRIIYVNDEAREKLPGEYPSGSVMIKEIYNIENGERGSIDYFALMRKLDVAPDGGELDNGWLFTMIDGADIDDDEVYFSRCWRTCHVAAPFDGTFLNYGQ